MSRTIKIGDSPAGVEWYCYQRGNETDARFAARCGLGATSLKRAHRRHRVRAMLRRAAARRATFRVNVTPRQADMIFEAFEYAETREKPITQRATYVVHTRDGWLDCLYQLDVRAPDDDDCQAGSMQFYGDESDRAIENKITFGVRALQKSRKLLEKKIERAIRVSSPRPSGR